jgi:hypothetical protein
MGEIQWLFDFIGFTLKNNVFNQGNDQSLEMDCGKAIGFF